MVHILLVDDERAICELAKRILEENDGDFHVDAVLSVVEALQKLRTAEYDVVVSDYKMPEKDGLEFLAELRDLGCETPFIFFTGRGGEELAAEACRRGADGYVIKRGNPGVFSQLSSQIRQAIQRREAEKALRESEQKYRTIVELTDDGIIMTTGPERTISFANRRMHEMLGYAVGELENKRYLDLVHSDEREETLRAIDADLKSKKPSLHERRLVKNDGSIVHVLVSSSLTNPRSQFSPAILVIREISE